VYAEKSFWAPSHLTAPLVTFARDSHHESARNRAKLEALYIVYIVTSFAGNDPYEIFYLR